MNKPFKTRIIYGNFLTQTNASLERLASIKKIPYMLGSINRESGIIKQMEIQRLTINHYVL